MLGASNLRQQRRLWTLLERPDMIKKTNEEREADREREALVLGKIMRTRRAAEWEVFLQSHHVPAARVRAMGEAVADPQFKSRGVIYSHPAGHGVEGRFRRPPCGFYFCSRWPAHRCATSGCLASTTQRSSRNLA